jgi:FKBP-type peptidyl-prolyl cis-trans isomerase
VVVVKYSGRLAESDTPFDMRDRFEFVLGRGDVISGWDVAVKEMSIGDEVEVFRCRPSRATAASRSHV